MDIPHGGVKATVLVTPEVVPEVALQSQRLFWPAPMEIAGLDLLPRRSLAGACSSGGH